MSSRTAASLSPRAPVRAKARRSGLTARPWWPWAKRLLTFGFFALVATLIFMQAREIEWGEVLHTLRGMPLAVLSVAAALAGASHLLYSCYDLLGRRYSGHTLPTPTVMLVTFISYAFNLNLGAPVGGIALRYRLYSRLGLDLDTVTRVMSISMLTNWLGYLFLAGTVFLVWPLALPPDWKLGNTGLRLLGGALLAAGCAYLVLCATAHERTWSLRGHEFKPPPLRFALLQVAMSAANWALIASVVYTLLQHKVPFPAVLSVMLAGAVAGVITHVPAGLGVLEAVFVALLAHQVPKAQLLAALLAYRALYYLAPLVVALLAYVVVEARAKRQRAAPKT